MLEPNVSTLGYEKSNAMKERRGARDVRQLGVNVMATKLPLSELSDLARWHL